MVQFDFLCFCYPHIWYITMRALSKYLITALFCGYYSLDKQCIRYVLLLGSHFVKK